MPISRTKTSIKPAAPFLLLAALLCGGSARAAAPKAPPEPDALLDAVLSPPEISYQGRIMFTQWFGKQTRAEEANIYQSGDRTRREYLAPDGEVARVLVSDGVREEVRLLKHGKVVRGDAVKSYEKLMTPERERELLLKNYVFEVHGPETVAGRPCWVLEMTPLVSGKPAQKLWIDQETRIVLEDKRFIPRRSSAAQFRYTRFETKKDLPAELFALKFGTAAAGKGLEPDFMTLEELRTATGKAADFPAELPGGFRFESADFFVVGKQTIRHARYTDGLAVLSLFQTDKPVRLPKSDARPAGASMGHASLRLSSAGKVLHWQKGRQHYTLLGDLTRELLQTVAASLK